jgi:hypothetical protein
MRMSSTWSKGTSRRLIRPPLPLIIFKSKTPQAAAAPVIPIPNNPREWQSTHNVTANNARTLIAVNLLRVLNFLWRVHVLQPVWIFGHSLLINSLIIN